MMDPLEVMIYAFYVVCILLGISLLVDAQGRTSRYVLGALAIAFPFLAMNGALSFIGWRANRDAVGQRGTFAKAVKMFR